MQADKPEIDLRAEIEGTINVLMNAVYELAPDEGYEQFFMYGAAIKRAKSLLKLLKDNEEEAILIAAKHVEHAMELEDFALFDPKKDVVGFVAPRSLEIANLINTTTK